jgi:hypothetical protein
MPARLTWKSWAVGVRRICSAALVRPQRWGTPKCTARLRRFAFPLMWTVKSCGKSSSVDRIGFRSARAFWRTRNITTRDLAERPEEIPALLATPSFLERFVRGDMQILSRHAVGLLPATGEPEHRTVPHLHGILTTPQGC